jgi:hypothetical protein
MSFQKKHQVLLQKIDNQIVANMVSNALRFVHKGEPSAIKKIGAISGFNLNTISKWYQAANAPQSAHLLMLAQAYPQVLQGILDIVEGGEAATVYPLKYDLQKKDVGPLPGTPKTIHPVDKYVQIDVFLDIDVARMLNHRQLWFVGELSKGKNPGVHELAEMWQKSPRTCRRDIKGLAILGLVKICKFNNVWSINKE